MLGHAIDQTFQLPVPLGLHLAGAGTAVAASFVVSAVAARSVPDHPHYPTAAIPASVARVGSAALALLGLAWWYGAIAVAFAIGGVSPLPVVLLWIGIWVGLPLVAIVLGNPWPSLSPFRTTLAGLERAGRLFGTERLDAGLSYPAGLGRWPAVLLLGIGLWLELVLPESNDAATVGWLMVAYALVTVCGAILFGRAAWLRSGELFEVMLGWFGRVGPLGRRAVEPALCEGCAEGCDPRHCVDCPECLAIADADELRPELRPWFAGLTEVRRAGWSDAAFIVLLLAGVTYDGLQETPLWTDAARALLPPLSDALGPALPITVIGTIGLLGSFGLFSVAFGLAVILARGLSDPARRGALGGSIGVYAATLLPIAAGYLLAHYFTLVVQGAIWLPALLADPLLGVAPVLSWMPAAFVWYLSVVAIVVGHVAAVVLAHRVALREAPARPVVAGLPLVALMIGYTIVSLWIIAQPIVIDPARSAGLVP